MKYFTDDYTGFFKELATNNHRDWFVANKKRYDKNIKEPFARFTTDVIRKIKEMDKDIGELEAKDCIFRINRDIRFGADKTPYKLHMSAAISPGGRKDHQNPGLYYQFGPEGIEIYGGIYMTEKEQLQTVRSFLAKHTKELRQIIDAAGFRKFYKGEILGEKNKVVPAEFKEAVAKEPLIANKQFYFKGTMDAKTISSESLLEKMMDFYHAAEGMTQFLRKALKG
jgi:uncharacterized protein (TIGR02453 family)